MILIKVDSKFKTLKSTMIYNMHIRQKHKQIAQPTY